MTITPLATRIVEKPWGRTDVGAFLGGMESTNRIGEIWFEPGASDVLVKFLFTSERLSVQVHPDDAQAQRMGSPRGKEECWLILSAEPGAHYGIGFNRTVSREQVAAAIADGSVVDLIDWRPARVGDFIYNPARTVHALGPGVTVLEVQQASDVTLRLYDYGSSRELHVAQSLDVMKLGAHTGERDRHIDFSATTILADGPYFGVAFCRGEPPNLRNVSNLQIIAWDKPVTISGTRLGPSSSAFVDTSALRSMAPGQAYFLAWSCASA